MVSFNGVRSFEAGEPYVAPQEKEEIPGVGTVCKELGRSQRAAILGEERFFPTERGSTEILATSVGWEIAAETRIPYRDDLSMRQHHQEKMNEVFASVMSGIKTKVPMVVALRFLNRLFRLSPSLALGPGEAHIIEAISQQNRSENFEEEPLPYLAMKRDFQQEVVNHLEKMAPPMKMPTEVRSFDEVCSLIKSGEYGEAWPSLYQLYSAETIDEKKLEYALALSKLVLEMGKHLRMGKGPRDLYKGFVEQTKRILLEEMQKKGLNADPRLVCYYWWHTGKSKEAEDLLSLQCSANRELFLTLPGWCERRRA